MSFRRLSVTRLCAPVKRLVDTDKVELLELDRGTHKLVYKNQELMFVDTDWNISPMRGKTKNIVSYHNFKDTPDLDYIFQLVQRTHPQADVYKLAAYARSTLDSLRMLEFLQRHPSVIGLCMGELGSITRICAPILGIPFMYAPLSKEEINVPGQLLADELRETYHFHQLNAQTKIFGLIGDPVDQSPGHLFHNAAFHSKGINAVYIKMPLQVAELERFFALVKKLPFGGISVTAPLKETVLPFIDEMDPLAQKIGAVNTLLFKNGKILGYNTDAAAALELLGEVHGKTIVILGAGGAARAIAFTALEKGAHVVVVNRTPSRAQALAENLGCSWSLTAPPYDILINATSASMPIEEQAIIPGKTVMDIALYETDFIRFAHQKECQVIGGEALYVLQATAQQKLWF